MASIDGASTFRTARSVVWPLAWPTLIAGGLLVGALSMTEVPATVLIFPEHPQVLTPHLMTWVHMAHYDSMIEASLLMMAIVLIQPWPQWHSSRSDCASCDARQPLLSQSDRREALSPVRTMRDQIDSFTLLLSAAALIALGWPHLQIFYRKWIALPIKSHATRKYPLEPQWEETNASQLSSEQRDFLRDTILGFRNAGFDVLANLRLKNQTSEGNAKTGLWLIPMMNPATGDFAAITMATTSHLRMLSFQVYSEFADGFYMTTANRRPGVYPTDPEIHSVRFDWVSDPATLIECHRRRVALSGRARSRRTPLLPDQVIEKVNESRRRELKWLLRTGYYFQDSSDNSVRLAWRGAILLRWRYHPVVKGWLIRRQIAKARQLWNELEMDNWKPAAAGQVRERTTIELTSDPAPPVEPTISLAYQSSLAPGQIRRERLNGTLILRIMLPTAAQIVERKLPDVGVSFFFAAYSSPALGTFSQVGIRCY